MYHLHFHPMHHRHLSHKQHLVAAFLLRDFGFSMVANFVPILLLLGGFPLYMVGVYFIISTTVRIITHFFLPRLYGSIGVQNTVRVSLFLSIPYIILLNFVGTSWSFLVITAIISGLMNTMFWVSRHLDMVHVVTKKRSTEQVSRYEIAAAILRIIGPFAAGIIGHYVSTDAMLAVAFGVFISAALLITQEAKIETSHKLIQPKLSKAFTNRNIAAHVANIGMNFQAQVSFLVWPTHIFLTFDNLSTVGGVLSLGQIFFVIMVYQASKATRKRLFYLAAISGRIASFLLRSIATTLGRVAGADVLGAVSMGTYLSLYLDNYYNQSRSDEDVAANVIAMEIVGDFGKLLLWLLFTSIVLSGLEDQVFSLIFIMAIPMVGLTYLMLPAKER